MPLFMTPSTSIGWVRALLGGGCGSAKSPHRVPSYNAWSLLPLNKGSKQEQQGIAKCNWLGSHSNPASQCPRHSKGLPSSNPPSQNYPAHGAYTEVACTQGYFLYNKQDNDCIEKARELWDLSGDFRNSFGSEVLVSAIVYVPIYFHGVSRGSILVLGPP